MTSSRSRRALVFVVLLVAACDTTATSGSVADPTISEVRDELLGYVGDIPGATGYRYAVTDDLGHEMDTAKIIQIAETGEFAAVYHWWSDDTRSFSVSLATSTNLLDWTRRVTLAQQASMPYIEEASDGGYVVAWEQEPDNHLKFAYYATWDGLLLGSTTKTFDAHQKLSGCAEGTPSIYSASSTEVDFGFHYFADCETDRQARGTTDWVTWQATPQFQLDRAAILQGYRGSIGDREVIDFKGYEFTFLESQFTQNDWRTFRFLLYDEELGARDQAGLTVGFGKAPPEPPSVHVFMATHKGSYSFTNLTATEVTIDGQRAIVFGVFIPMEGGRPGEIGQLIYYRVIDEP